VRRSFVIFRFAPKPSLLLRLTCSQARKQSGGEYVPKMFMKGENGWTFKDPGPYKGKGEGKDEDSDDDIPVVGKCVPPDLLSLCSRGLFGFSMSSCSAPRLTFVSPLA